ncbi:MAG TPA: ABC transporter substrate-binding protein, partial [Acidimicrobiales bacterium]|nr:ABC transporter substrate-binding protein [Acidimicrobiales bacterium]
NMAGPLGYLSTTCRANNIVVLDPLTVQFNFTAPYIPFLKQLNVTEAAVNPASALPAFPPGVDGCPTQAQADAVKVGTGPFKFDSINQPQADDGKVVRNPSYWRPGLPFLDAILMRPYTDETARHTALVNGQVDFVWDAANSKVAELNANPAFRTGATQALGGGPNSIDTVVFNLKASGSSVASVANGTAAPHPVLGDLRVRTAIFHAFDRQEFLDGGRYGIGKVAVAPISSEIFGHAPDLDLPGHNLNAADALLNAAGWNGPRQTVNGTADVRTALGHPTLADGTALTIRFLQGSVMFNDRVAVMKSNLAAVGIDLAVEVDTAMGSANTKVFTNRNFDLYIVNYAHGYDPHVGVRRQYHSDQISTSGTPNNAAGYRNALVDAAFDDAARTLDAAARFDLYHAAQEQIVADLPYVWMIETPNVRAWSARCTGIKTFELFAERAGCKPA